MPRSIDYSITDKLEAMVDANSLSAVLEALATVCDEKANHIRENWQDGITARPWENAGARLAKLASQFGI